MCVVWKYQGLLHEVAFRALEFAMIGVFSQSMVVYMFSLEWWPILMIFSGVFIVDGFIIL